LASTPPFFSMLPPPPSSPLFPYTTLFRSRSARPSPRRASSRRWWWPPRRDRSWPASQDGRPALRRCALSGRGDRLRGGRGRCRRSEEHTSELQSLRHLVCRLLLEKKKQKQ